MRAYVIMTIHKISAGLLRLQLKELFLKIIYFEYRVFIIS